MYFVVVILNGATESKLDSVSSVEYRNKFLCMQMVTITGNDRSLSIGSCKPSG